MTSPGGPRFKSSPDSNRTWVGHRLGDSGDPSAINVLAASFVSLPGLLRSPLDSVLVVLDSISHPFLDHLDIVISENDPDFVLPGTVVVAGVTAM